MFTSCSLPSFCQRIVVKMEREWQNVCFAIFIYMLFVAHLVAEENKNSVAASGSHSATATSASPHSVGTVKNVSTQNGTKSTMNTEGLDSSKRDAFMLHRAFYVMLGVMAIGMLYFIVRAVRVKKTPKKKYGLLSNYDDNMEMAHLDSDDDDDTVFESKNLRR
ncbi:protein FAM174C [Protopterus annectens]|uniref:protein FAM174C n=1 Tax=Protopterus annectens TaxID=7888 RepID=UPI001CFABF64|nr:protein FAM174C [Protopterus annectens]